jgi:phospholipid/cholesterol/gamma-HCH transport system permease protein
LAEAGTGRLGAVAGPVGRKAIGLAAHTGRVVALLRETCGWIFVAPFRRKTEHRRHVGPLMVVIGNRSLGIVALVNALIGAILVLQTAEQLQRFGQLDKVSGLVAVSMTRELGPMMTAIIFILRVGSAFTASLGLMKNNEELLALETMGISPLSYLVAPRLVASWFMLPALTVFASLVGIGGGCLVAAGKFGLDPGRYIRDTMDFLVVRDLWCGVLKSAAFATIITGVSCHLGMEVEGGSEGLMRNMMLSAVACLVAVVLCDLLFTGVLLWV